MDERLRVCALAGGGSVPSSRFRVAQLLPALGRAGVDVDWRPARVSCYPPARRWLRPLWLPATLLAPELGNERFGMLAEVTSGPLVVAESAMYWNAGGTFWAGGSSAPGVRVR